MSLVVAPPLGAVAVAAASAAAVAASTVIRGARLTHALFEVHYGDHTSLASCRPDYDESAAQDALLGGDI